MFKIFLASLFLSSSIANAAYTPLGLKGRSDSTYVPAERIEVPLKQLTTISDKKVLIETANDNIVDNAGFEGTISGWTVSGGASQTVQTAVPLNGSRTLEIDVSPGNAGTATSPSYTVPLGFSGKNAEITFITSGAPTRDITFEVYDGNNTLLATTSYKGDVVTSVTLNFIFPINSVSTTVYYKISVATAPTFIYKGFFDDVRIRPATNIGSIAQAQFVGSKTYTPTASCVWQTTSAALASFAADSDCSAPIIGGTGLTGSSKDLKVTVTNGQPGIYVVRASFSTYHSSTDDIKYALTDGTTQKNQTIVTTGASSNKVVTLEASYEYTSAVNATFEILGATPSGTANLRGDTVAAPMITVTRFPGAAETALRLNVDPTLTAPVAYTPTFTGWGTVTGINFKSYRNGTFLYVDGTFTAGTTTATEARISLGFNGVDSSVTTVSTLPTLSNVGAMGASGTASATYFGGADVLSEASKTYMTLGIHSSTAAGLSKSNGNSFTSSVTYSLHAKFEINGWTAPTISMPLVTQSVVSGYAGVAKEIYSEINCDASSAITSQSGGISTVGNRSTASCALTLVTGTYSATPWYCGVTVKAATVQASSCSCSSATACTIYGASADYDAYVNIVGPK